MRRSWPPFVIYTSPVHTYYGMLCCRDGTRTSDLRKTATLYQLSFTAYHILLASPKPSELFYLTASFSLQLCLLFFVHVAIAHNHSALLDSLHAHSALHYYLSALLFTSGPTRGHCWFGTSPCPSGCTYGLNTVLPLHSFSGLFRCCLIVSSLCQWFAYLPGLPLHVPRRLRKVRDSNPRVISDSRVSSAVLSTSQPTFLVLTATYSSSVP